MALGNVDEETFVGGCKPDHLYTANFRNEKGKFFNIVTLDDVTTIEYQEPPTRNRIKLTVTFIKESNEIKQVSFKKFKELKAGWVETGEEATFSHFSFQKLVTFLSLLTELDLASVNERRVALSQADSDSGIDADTIKKIKTLLIRPEGQKIIEELINVGIITSKDIVNIGYRKNQLDIFYRLLNEEGYLEIYRQKHNINDTKPEKAWQYFFKNNDWIFGFGLDYRYLGILQKEAHVSPTDTVGRDGSIGDFLMGGNKFTVLVELKRPDTLLFSKAKGSANAWRLSEDLIHAVSQILEQKASWQVFAETNANKNFTDKNDLIKQRTVDPKSILIIGSDKQFKSTEREAQIKERTFELFRRDSRNIEILTYDELFERASFVVTSGDQTN